MRFLSFFITILPPIFALVGYYYQIGWLFNIFGVFASLQTILSILQVRSKTAFINITILCCILCYILMGKTLWDKTLLGLSFAGISITIYTMIGVLAAYRKMKKMFEEVIEK